jgi:hypothetical protein
MINNILNRSSKEATYLKIDTLQDIKYINNFNLVSEVLLKWSKLKSNKELDKIISAMSEIAFYNIKLKEERDNMLDIVSEYRADKLRAVQRARKAEEKLNKI